MSSLLAKGVAIPFNRFVSVHVCVGVFVCVWQDNHDPSHPPPEYDPTSQIQLITALRNLKKCTLN